MNRLPVDRWMRVLAVSAVTWIGCAGFVRVVGFESWIAITTGMILAGAVAALAAAIWRG